MSKLKYNDNKISLSSAKKSNLNNLKTQNPKYFSNKKEEIIKKSPEINDKNNKEQKIRKNTQIEEKKEIKNEEIVENKDAIIVLNNEKNEEKKDNDDNKDNNNNKEINNNDINKEEIDKNSYLKLTQEEINILSLAMVIEWYGQQLAITDNTRMKYSGSDFKMTSQANHMAKLKVLIDAAKQDCLHMQRLYGRRNFSKGKARSTAGLIMTIPDYGYKRGGL